MYYLTDRMEVSQLLNIFFHRKSQQNVWKLHAVNMTTFMKTMRNVFMKTTRKCLLTVKLTVMLT